MQTVKVQGRSLIRTVSLKEAERFCLCVLTLYVPVNNISVIGRAKIDILYYPCICLTEIECRIL